MESRGTGVSAIVEFDYAANELDELHLTKGTVITNIRVQPGGWWHGTIASTGKSGMFPDNFVKLLDQQNDDKVILRDKALAKNRRCKVIYSYKESKDDELTLAVGDLIEVFEEVEDGWWKGKLGSKVGVFPSNFVEVIDSTSPISANRKSHNINSTIIQNKINNNRSSLTSSREDLVGHGDGDVPLLPPKPIREMCKVLYAYNPVNEDELKLSEGDVVTLLSRELPDKGWWKGELRGKTGVFPDNFVTLLPSDPSPTKERPERPPIGTKTIITANTTSTTIKPPNPTTNSFRKDSFGSKDSLNDSSNLISTERNSGLFGNVAAHRRSLESKSHEGTAEKPPRKSLVITDANKTPSDIRKSLENLDEKKTPPPVLSKKPTVPIKKSPSVSTVGSIFSGLKSKVKSVESKLHAAHDGTDGLGSSKLSGAAHIADNGDKGVVIERIRKDENELDHVERGSSVLQDVRQNRAKAPKRRPPTSAGSLNNDSNNNVSMNGSHLDSSFEPEPISSSPPKTDLEDELAKPKAREWEKHRAPWMAELKASQAKKTSPSIEPRSSPDEEKQDMSKSFSSSFAQKKTQDTFEMRTTSMEVKSNSFDVFKKEKEPVPVPAPVPAPVATISTNIDSNAKSTTKISITENSSSVMTSSGVKVEENSIRPTSVSLRNRSISPISRTSLNHVSKPTPTSGAVTATHLSGDSSSRVNELEQRVVKLEGLVSSQNATIEELKKMLKDESDKVRVLKNDLEKYAQCFTQKENVAKFGGACNCYSQGYNPNSPNDFS